MLKDVSLMLPKRIVSILALLFAIQLINPAQAMEVRIGLGDDQSEATISATTNYRLRNTKTKVNLGDFTALSKTKVLFTNNVMKLIHEGEEIGAYKGPIDVLPYTQDTKKGLVSHNGKWYRGTLRLFPSKTKRGLFVKKAGMTIVNNVDMEDYLKGVVPSEMPSRWHPEALKAQAICARTYTLSKLGRRDKLGYDLKNTIEDQVYAGFSSEKLTTSNAISATAERVLIDRNGEIIEAYYSSSAGGHTDSIQDVWGLEPKSYLVPRKSYDDNSPHYSWTKEFTQEELTKKLSGFNVGNVLAITPVNRTFAKRVKSILVDGSDGRVNITGEEIRHKLALPSTLFNVGVRGSQMVFAGRGFGHGLGLSQYGAKSMAERGYSFKRILQHFYPTTRLVQL